MNFLRRLAVLLSRWMDDVSLAVMSISDMIRPARKFQLVEQEDLAVNVQPSSGRSARRAIAEGAPTRPCRGVRTVARVPVRRMALAIAAVAVFACRGPGLAEPLSSGVSLAAIETESAGPDVNGEASTDAGHPAPELPTTGNPLWAIPVSKLSATRDRPLFSASRRPRTPTVAAAPIPTVAAAPIPTVAAQPSAPETPPFTLVGTIIGENSRIAIFFVEALGTATAVKEGESNSGWILRSIDPRSAILDGSGRTVTLELPEPAAQESPAPQSPAPRFKPRIPPPLAWRNQIPAQRN